MKNPEASTRPCREHEGAAHLFAAIPAAFLCTLLLAGCVTTPEPDYEKLGLKIPEGWTERAANKPMADAEWVTTFRDPKLKQIVDEALANNYDLKSTAARIRQARSNVIIAGADRKPQVSGEFDGVRTQRNFIGFPRGTSGTTTDGAAPVETVQTTLSNSFGLDLNLTWELDLWGRVAAAKSASLAELQASEADFRAAQLSIASQTAKGWFALIAAKEQTELSERALQIFNQTQEIIRTEFEKGLGENAAGELQLALADVENSRAAVYQRQEELMRSNKLLEVILGRYPSSELRSASRLPSMPGAPPAGIPAELLERRPDLVAAERRLSASDERIVQAKRSLLPAVTLTGAYGTSTEDLSDIFDTDFTVWSIAGRAAQPLLDGKRLRATVQLREAEAEAALANFEQTALTAFREVEEALAADSYQAKRVAALQKAVALGRDALDRARDDYVGGVGDVLTLLRAQQQLINSESALIDARRQRLDNRVDLHVALGGDFRSHEPSEIVNKKRETLPEADSASSVLDRFRRRSGSGGGSPEAEAGG